MLIARNIAFFRLKIITFAIAMYETICLICGAVICLDAGFVMGWFACRMTDARHRE